MDSAITDLTKNFEEGTEYFKVSEASFAQTLDDITPNLTPENRI